MRSRLARACAVGLSCTLLGCQQAKPDTVTILDVRPPPTPDETDREPEPVATAGIDSGVGPVPSGDAPRPDTVSGEPVLELDAGRTLPVDPAAVALAFPIVFRSNRNAEGTTDLYVMRADGSEPQRITRGGDYLLPRWSPDGSRILFRRQVQTGTFSADVGIVSPDGSETTMLTTGENVALFQLPANWSVDGQSITFGSVVPNDGFWAFSMAPTGGQRTRLLPAVAAYQREAAWAPPDGARLAYIEADATARATALFVTDPANPDEPINLSEGKVALPLELRWSPDGRRIAVSGFALTPDGNIEGMVPEPDGGAAHYPHLDVFVVDVETRAVTRMTNVFGGNYEPAWSPDGTLLLFTSDSGEGDEDIWVMPVAAPEQARRLTVDLPRGEGLPAPSDGGADWYVPRL